MSGDTLLDRCLAAHGGLDRWRQLGAIDVDLTTSGLVSGQFIPFMSGITAACGAVEALSRTLATEFGPAGVRVNCVRAGGMPEPRTIAETTANMAATTRVQTDEAARSTATNVLRRPMRVEETAATVVWVASDLASGVAAQVFNVCAGAIVSR